MQAQYNQAVKTYTIKNCVTENQTQTVKGRIMGGMHSFGLQDVLCIEKILSLESWHELAVHIARRRLWYSVVEFSSDVSAQIRFFWSISSLS